MNQIPTLDTARLTLRPFSSEDAPAVEEMVGALEVAHNTLLIPHPYPKGAALQWIETHGESFEQRKKVSFAIVLREDRRLVGAITLVLKLDHDIGDLGYWIGVPYWNRGYGTEAVGAVIEYGFNSWPLNRIEAFHFSRNPASGRVMMRNGMRYEGTHREAAKKWDEYVDLDGYAILRAEWKDSSTP